MVLPAPVGPDDGDRLARLDDEVEVLDERRVGDVAERDVLEGRPARGRRGRQRRGATGSGDLLGLVEQLEHPLGRRDRRLEDVGDRRRPG